MSAVGRSNLVYALGGIALGLLVAFVTFVPTIRRAIIQERQSPYDFATTVQTIQDNAIGLGWTVTGVQDFDPILAQVEDPAITQLRVVELCHHGYASEMLTCKKTSCVAMMPCTVAVYERDGQVYVATLNRGLIGRLYRKEAATVMRKVRADEREMLQFAAVH